MIVVTTVPVTMEGLAITNLETATAQKDGQGAHVHNVRYISSLSVCLP